MFSTQSAQSTLPLQNQLNSPLVGSLTTPDQVGTLSDPIGNQTLFHASAGDLATQSLVTPISNYSNLVSPVVTLDPSIIVWFSDNTMAGATQVSSLSSVQTFNNFVGSSDTQDYYRFNLAYGGSFNLSLTGLSADADVYLMNSVGSVIASSTRSGAQDEAINVAGLAAGDYYVRVFQFNGDTNYTLQLSGNNPSNLLPVETNVGLLSGTQTFSGYMSNLNTADTYSFSVMDALTWNGWIPTWQSTNINITLSGLSSDADVRLIRDANGNGIIDGSDVLTGSYRSGSVAEWISSSLSTGTYFVQVYQYSGNSNYHLSISTGDWYSQNLSDAGIIGEARYAARDGQISRNDMMAILRETKDYGTIDATEVTDLRRLLSDRGYLMPEHVRVLTNKTINGNVANTRSGIGNLFAGSSATQMENLIGKWFLGNDRPTAIAYNKSTAYGYQYVSGSLFQGGISAQDVQQQDVADCYFMASLAATAAQNPSNISSLFIDNYDGTYTVRLYNNGVADYVTVDRYLPVNASGNAVFGGWGGGHYSSSSNELWAALLEKAYAQFNEEGWIGQDNTNSYNGPSFSSPIDAGIGWGYTNVALSHVTGVNAGWSSNMNTTNILNAFNAGRRIVLNDSSHAYAVIGYNNATNRFIVYNPYGSTTQYTHAQLASTFSGWAATNS
ncbi:C2 family cysteine protease [Pantanalinema rosaneae CENA516]|uniref:C2 family cysteine protease n=1 Tax=Pantanalinema rosaneae TaxID=1620701 RepID=UPI003D6FD145